jgi:predicted phosphodiesterase
MTTKQIVEANPTASLDELVALCKNKVSREYIRKLRVKLGLPPYKVTSQNIKKQDPEFIKNSFEKFLSKGKTEAEIIEEFGDEGRNLLKLKYDGREIVTQRDDFGRKVFILLSLPPVEVEIKPRAWSWVMAGPDQPYVIANISHKAPSLFIAPLFDVHFGQKAHKAEKFKSYLRWIASTPNVYVILGGDLMENAIDDGRGMTYDQVHNPESQFNEMYRMLAPIAHKVLVSVPGNHEERTYKKTGIDIAAVLAKRLGIPYFAGPTFLDVLFASHRFTFYVTHGRGNSQTKGGKMNSAGRARKFTSSVQFFVSGHTHDRVCEAETVLHPNPITCTLEQKEQWTIVAPSFLDWYDTYAYRAGYPPPAKGGVSMELFNNGDYRAHQT